MEERAKRDKKGSRGRKRWCIRDIFLRGMYIYMWLYTYIYEYIHKYQVYRRPVSTEEPTSQPILGRKPKPRPLFRACISCVLWHVERKGKEKSRKFLRGGKKCRNLSSQWLRLSNRGSILSLSFAPFDFLELFVSISRLARFKVSLFPTQLIDVGQLSFHWQCFIDRLIETGN